ncbi:hypothetical protein RJZ56_002762 [Blastomyces dermatitidis]
MAMNRLFWHFCEWFYGYPEPPPRVRTKPMQGWDIIFEDPLLLYTQGWVRLARKKLFDALLGHSVAVADSAASCFAPELIAAYAEAKKSFLTSGAIWTNGMQAR